MADFRKLFLALIAGALLFTAVASAQPYSCTPSAAPTLGRSEGIAELAGDVLLVCTGSVPLDGILVNIRYRLTQNITSDLEPSPTTEALLILDGGADGFQAYGAAAGQQNVYQARRISDDEIEWAGVWLAAQGTSAFKTIRLTNVRGNARAAGDYGTLFATINFDPPTSVPLNGAGTLRVMDTRPGLSFSVTARSYKNCESSSDLLALKFTEGYAGAFKPVGVANVDNVVPGGAFRNESGFAPSSLVVGTLTGTPGQANQGTRLMARFKNVPSGTTLKVPVRIDSGNGLTAILVGTPNADGSGGAMVGVPASYPLLVGPPAQNYSAIDQTVPSSGLVVYQVYSITTGSFSSVETVSVPVSASYTVPGPLGTGTVGGSFAPLSTVVTMNADAPEPRFADTATDTTVITISPCRTILLFPYVTNQAGFDTGVAIANTTADPLGTVAQAGICTINYYGNTNGSTGPVAQTSPSVGAGSHLAFMLSGGGGVFARNGGFTACASGACVAPLFQGYIIAICDFQLAHGFAYVSDVQNDPSGRTLGAMGYLALIIPDRGTSTGSRLPQDNSLGNAGNQGEQLGN